MALTLVATPIGHPKDITVRSLELIEKCDVVIGEEMRELTTFLKRANLPEKEMHLLNEHSSSQDVIGLAQLCVEKNVVLVSDCGTPGFCDPGAALVSECRKRNIKVQSAPGPSSLMTILSLSSERLGRFVFEGFLPAENEARTRRLQQIKNEKGAIVLMDTPYRLSKLLSEVASVFENRRALLGLNLTQRDEQVFEGSLSELAGKVQGQKAEFMLLIYPGAQ